MSRGFQPDPLVEHAALTEVAAAVQQWRDAEAQVRHVLRRALDDGARSQVIAEAVGMSRTTLYRWLSSDQA